MWAFIVTTLLSALAFFIGARLLSGVTIKGFLSAIVLALVVALLDATLGRVLDFITAPIRWLTLGLFAWVVNAVIIMLADYFLSSVRIRNFWWALALAAVVAVVNWLTSYFYPAG